MLRGRGVTHPGRIREINEDAFLSEPDLGLFLVADGMGGHSAGELASRLAIDAISAFVARTKDTDDVTWPYGIESQLSYHGNRLATAIRLANRRVYKTSESHDDYTGMGTTVVAALVAGGRLVYAGVGDSRLYSFLDGTLTQLTRDDSWVATVRAVSSDVDEAALARHPMRHVLTNVLGAREQVDLEVEERPLAPHEILLLSSDGLHGALGDEDIGAVLAGTDDLEDAAARLVQMALERDGSDNITAVLVRDES